MLFLTGKIAFMTKFKYILAVALLLLVATLAACGTPAGSNSNSHNQSTATATSASQVVSTNPTRTPAPAGNTTPQAVTPQPTNANAPLVILTPTRVPGGSGNSVLINLPDRTLEIKNVTRQNGSEPDTMNVGLVMTLTNKGTKTIQNTSTFYQLVGSEGDTFGIEVSATPSYFGTLTPHSSRSGTIVFAVPSEEANGLRLLFRCEILSETAIVAI
jgi:hypothetical protein